MAGVAEISLVEQQGSALATLRERRAPPLGDLACIAAVALAARLLGLIFLPNPEQDAYSYAEQIAAWTDKFRAGEFALRDLFGFWLPLYQLLSTALALVVGEPLLAGRIVSAVFGLATSLVIYLVAAEMGARRAFALTAALFAALSPLHLIYSVGSLTDVPHACLIAASTLAAIRMRWFIAAALLTAAALMRVEAWILLPVLPAGQYLKERRVSPAVLLLIIAAPCAWLFISWHATGNWFAYFAERSSYLDAYLAHSPSRTSIQPADLWRDLVYLTHGGNIVVLCGAGATAAGCAVAWIRGRRPLPFPLAFASAVFGALSAFLAAAYFSRNQPVLWPRYGLLLFVAGLPLFVLTLERLWNVKRFRLIAFVVLLAAGSESLRQIAAIPPIVANHRARLAIATELVGRLRETGGRAFSDDVAVRVLSRLPSSTFRRTAHTPKEVRISSEAFLRFLRRENVRFVIISDFENSLPNQLARSETALRLVRRESARFEPDLALYELPPQ